MIRLVALISIAFGYSGRISAQILDRATARVLGDSLVYEDASHADLAEDADIVLLWDSSTGVLKHLDTITCTHCTGDATYRTNVLNGHAVVEFDSVTNIASTIGPFDFLHEGASTVALVFKPDGPIGTINALAETKPFNVEKGIAIAITADSTLSYRIGNGAANVFTFSSTAKVLIDWNVVICTFDNDGTGDDAFIYMSSTTVDASTARAATVVSGNSADPFTLGRHVGSAAQANQRFFGGQIAEVTMWNFGFTSAQVDSAFEELACLYDVGVTGVSCTGRARRRGHHRTN